MSLQGRHLLPERVCGDLAAPAWLPYDIVRLLGRSLQGLSIIGASRVQVRERAPSSAYAPTHGELLLVLPPLTLRSLPQLIVLDLLQLLLLLLGPELCRDRRSLLVDHLDGRPI